MPSLAFELGNSFIASFSHGLSAKEKQLVTEMFKPNSVIYCQNENEIDEFIAADQLVAYCLDDRKTH